MSNDQQSVGDIIEANYYASQGVRTGTAYNDMLVSEREQYQHSSSASEPTSSIAIGNRTSRSGGGSKHRESVFDIVDDLFDSIPRSIFQIYIATGFLGRLAYGMYTNMGWSSLMTGLLGMGAAMFSIPIFRIVAKLIYLVLGIALASGLVWIVRQIFWNSGVRRGIHRSGLLMKLCPEIQHSDPSDACLPARVSNWHLLPCK